MNVKNNGTQHSESDFFLREINLDLELKSVIFTLSDPTVVIKKNQCCYQSLP